MGIDELKPCPFCRGEVIHEDDAPQHYFTCQQCNATTNIYSHNSGFATAAWNTRPEPEWMPIESAPKDGTRFIAGHRVTRISQQNYFERYIAVWAKEGLIPTDDEAFGEEGNDGEYYCPAGFYREAQDKYGDEQYISAKPTHWMPLPEGPK